MNKKIVITGGGTGGHVFPALSIADELKSRGWEVLYVGTSRGMEAKLVPEKGYPFFTLNTGAVKNQSPLTIVKTLFRLLGATVWSLGFLQREKPDAVLGVGGYVSFPISFAAFLLRIPLYLQEQNVSVGISNRILGRMANHIFLGFEGATNDLPAHKCKVTGNPLRASFFEKAFRPYDPERLSLFVMGGSQGAKAINEALLNLMPKLKEKFPTLSVVHQTGASDFERVQAGYRKLNLPNIEARPFISDMVSEYEKATLVVSRSGALSISELINVARPAVFVPYPRQGQNDQTANAYLLETKGVARVVEQGENFQGRLWDTLLECLNPIKLRAMSMAFESFPKGNAAKTIGDVIEKNVL